MYRTGIIRDMKKSDNVLPPEQSPADRAHLAWCALVALHTVRQDGRAQSALAVHAFLVNWLATAQKQRRFPRSVATDIDSLLHLGRQKGLASNLQQRLESLWQSCTESVAQQSDLFRLTYAIEHLKSLGWVNAVVADAEWQSQALQAEYAGTDALLVRKSELVRQFAEDGRLTGDIAFRVVGDSRVVVDVLNAGGFDCALHEQHGGGCLLILLPPEETSADVQAVG